MCGIVGFVNKKKEQEGNSKLIDSMIDSIIHRGGDARGCFVDKNVAIGHTRLAILDLSTKANQPLECLNYTLSYNGEIYNHDFLREKKLSKVAITSNSDTATLFELLKRYSVNEVLENIQGMYSFAFYDSKRSEIILVVDKFGIKPLYYIDTPNWFAWSSEVKAFKELPDFQFQVNENRLQEYLEYRYVLGEGTLFRNIKRVMPGEYLIYNVKKEKFITKTYFSITKSNSLPVNLEEVLRDSVHDHLMGDAKVGVQLSGGIDSSLIGLFAQEMSKNKIHTFSVGLKDNNWNEFKYSDFIAEKIQSTHHKIVFEPKDFMDNLRAVIYHLDEPLVHPNTVAMYLLAKKARSHVKVLLTGEGADEVFCGYHKYTSLIEGQDLKQFISIIKPEQAKKLLKKISPESVERDKINDSLNGDVINRMSMLDLRAYLPHVLLRQDKAGMMANIENRVPFLYEPVVQYGYNLNSDCKVGEQGTKTPLKEIALKYFPKDFVLRKKCGFGLPISDWLKDDNVMKPLLTKLLESKFIRSYFQISEIKVLIKEHLDTTNKDNSTILFALICIDIWEDIFIKGNLPI